MEHVGGYWHVFFVFPAVPSLSLQTTVIAYMQQTSQNHRCVWVGDTEGFPKNIPMFAMTSTHMLFFATCIAESFNSET